MYRKLKTFWERDKIQQVTSPGKMFQGEKKHQCLMG